LIHGRDERFFYPKEIAPILLECAIKVAFALPDGSLTILSHCGHWPQLERAATFNKLSIDFLSHVDSK
jgi:pimeloyl-ACP methyl ester carboxylesterase